MKSRKSFDAWVIASRRDCLQRRKSARRIAANGSSSSPGAWKTPHGLSSSEGGGGEFHKQATHWQTPAIDSFRSRGGDRKDEMGLDQQSRNWPTARAEDAESCGNHPGAADSLTGIARSWPTPCANPAPRGKNFAMSDGHYHPHDLTTAASQWPTPNANNGKGVQNVADCKAQGHQVKLQDVAVSSFRLGPANSTHGAKSSPNTRRLNPLFVESLMGLPPGWTDYAPLEMASFRSWLHTHSCALWRLMGRLRRPLQVGK
jgi:DNA (cytosine-5)-methyltransferase 1